MAEDYQEGDVKFLYDLRQRRAKVIGDQIDLIASLSRTNMYYEYYKAIDFLYAISKHAYDSDDKKYNELKKNIFDTANNYKQTWLGINRSSEGADKIDSALKEFLQWVMHNIEESGLFGTTIRSEYEGI